MTLARNKQKKVVGMITAYNCGQTILQTVANVPKNTFDYLFITEDHSTDDTLFWCKKTNLPLFTHKNLGYGGNVQYGLEKALRMGASYIVEIHGDNQYDTRIVPQAIAKMQKDHLGFLLGTRFHKPSTALHNKMPLVRFLANRFLSFFDRLVLGVQLSEFHSGFRIYSRELLETVGFAHTSKNFLYSFEIIAQAAFYKIRVGEMPVVCNYKEAHTSISIKNSVLYAVQMFGILYQFLLAKIGVRTGIFSTT